MEGSTKPNVEKLGKEGLYKVISMNPAGGSGGTIEKCGLFDGNLIGSSSSSSVFYWSTDIHFIEIELFQKSNIWRSGISQYPQINDVFKKISKWNGTEYEDITSLIVQTTSQINNTKWEKTISNLPKGRYKFAQAYRIDSEWYIESLNNSKYLLKQNNQYYTIKPGFHQLLGQPTDNTQLANWIKEYGADDLTTLNTQYNKNSTVSVVGTMLGAGRLFEIAICDDFKTVDKIY